MKRLLNISTHDCDLDVIGRDWNNARAFLARNGFDGFELSPTDTYDCGRIPAELITGLHLRFFPIVEAMWRDDRARLIEIFDTDENIALYYGGPDREAITSTYRRQLALAERLGCEYVVFHVAQTDLEAVYTGRYPWAWQQTVELCAEIINEAMRESAFTGQILFENLWFPGSMRLDSPDEIALLLQKVDYPRSGLVLDTGHVLNKDPDLRSEEEGLEYLLETVRALGEARHLVKAVHLTRSLSGEYVTRLCNGPDPFHGVEGFWERHGVAQWHVLQTDQHGPWEHPGIARLFDWVAPDYLVYEFYYSDMTEWEAKIERQDRALGRTREATAPQ